MGIVFVVFAKIFAPYRFRFSSSPDAFGVFFFAQNGVYFPMVT
jgi:hypothetical protein